MSNDRRRSTRIEILGRIHGRVASLEIPVTVREMSLGGMAIETPVAFPAGAKQHFSLTLGDGSAVLLSGVVRHCRQLSDAPAFLSGIEFVDDEPGDDSPVSDLINRVS
jgi:hypothetical protein